MCVDTRATTLMAFLGPFGLGGLGMLFSLPLDLWALRAGLEFVLAVPLAVFGFESCFSLVAGEGKSSSGRYWVP